MPDQLLTSTSASRLQIVMAANECCCAGGSSETQLCGGQAGADTDNRHRLLRLHGSIGAARRRTAGLRADVQRLLRLARLARARGDIEACCNHVSAARTMHRQAQKLDAFAALCAVRTLRIDGASPKASASSIM